MSMVTSIGCASRPMKMLNKLMSYSADVISLQFCFRLQTIVWLVSKISETVLDKMQIQTYLGPIHTERQQGVCDTATDIAPIDCL